MLLVYLLNGLRVYGSLKTKKKKMRGGETRTKPVKKLHKSPREALRLRRYLQVTTENLVTVYRLGLSGMLRASGT